jgi:hypothetical protein
LESAARNRKARAHLHQLDVVEHPFRDRLTLRPIPQARDAGGPLGVAALLLLDVLRRLLSLSIPQLRKHGTGSGDSPKLRNQAETAPTACVRPAPDANDNKDGWMRLARPRDERSMEFQPAQY